MMFKIKREDTERVNRRTGNAATIS